MAFHRWMSHAAEIKKRHNSLWPLPQGVVDVDYRFDNDWSGDPAIFFEVTLTDDAARREVLLENGQRVAEYIRQKMDPLEEFGLLPYFRFQSQSEQANLRQPIAG